MLHHHPPRASHTHKHHQYKHGQHKSTTINPLPPNTLLQTRSYRSQTELSISLGHKAEERTHRRTPGPVKAFKRHQTTAAGIVLAHGLGGDCYVKCRQRRRKWEERWHRPGWGVQRGTAGPGLGHKTLPGGSVWQTVSIFCVLWNWNSVNLFLR